MTNRLLARTGEIVQDNGQVKGHPKIEVMDSDPWTEGAFDDALLYDFQFPQTVLETNEPMEGGKYGFNNQYSGAFLHVQNPYILTVMEPEGKTAVERWQEMRHQEDNKFDKDWYLADLLEPPTDLEEILQYKLPENMNDPFTAEEQESLRNLGNRECGPPSNWAYGSFNREPERCIFESSTVAFRDSVRQILDVGFSYTGISMDDITNITILVLFITTILPSDKQYPLLLPHTHKAAKNWPIQKGIDVSTLP
jgi:hypothetical protein